MLHDHWEITLLIDDIRIVIGYLSEMTGGNRVVVMIEIEKRLKTFVFKPRYLPNALNHGETSSKIVQAERQEG